mmetsp:Transcript_48746/g.80779  ORF Transcript_48746/g.80779 Transcript_48746/m.80779 type:complete len:668 (-) Transcript_48746:144-2147(-)
MLASAWRSLTLTSFGNDGEAPKVVQRSPLGSAPDVGPAVSLAWDETGSHVIVAVSSEQPGSGSQVYFWQALPQRGSSGLQGIVPVSRDCGVSDLSVQSSEEDQTCWALAACTDGNMCLIDASSARAARVEQKYRCFRGTRASSVELAKNLQCFACGSANGQVLLQPLSEDNFGHSPLASSAADAEVAINCLRFSPKRPEVLAAAGANGQIQVWDTNSLKRVLELPAHSTAARSLSFSRHNEALLISAGTDAMLMFWDVRSGKAINEIRVEAPLESLSYHADGYRVAVGTALGTVLLYDLRKMKDQSVDSTALRHVGHKDEGCKGLRAMAWGPLQLNRADLELTAVSPRNSPASQQTSLGHTPADVSPKGDAPTSGAHGGPAVPRGMAPLELHSGSFPGSRVTRDLASEFEDVPTRGPSNSSVQELYNQLSSRKPSSAVQAQATPVTRRVSAPETRGASVSTTTSSASEVRHAVQPLPSTPLNSHRNRPSAASTREPMSFSMSNNTPQPAEVPSSGAGNASLLSPWWSSESAGSDARVLSAPRQRSGPAGATPAASGGVATGTADTPLLANAAANAGAEILARHRAQLAGGAPEDAPGMLPEAAAPSSQVPEALRPWLEELRRDICREVREAQYCMMEQNFRLHVELRREVEELRAEVQVLRGEMQAL